MPKRSCNIILILFAMLFSACGESATPAVSMPTHIPPLSGNGGGVIAYTSLRNFNWQIFVVNADGSGQMQVPIDPRYGYEPSWAPGGTRLVFQSVGLWITDIASGDTNLLPLSASSDELPNPYLVKPSWSPLGDWIAFLNESGIQGDIYLVRPDGSDLTRLTNTDDISRDGNLVWSPDGQKLAFSANRDGNMEIYVIDVTAVLQGDEAIRQLTDTIAPIRNLVSDWSPNGSRIAFSSDRDGNSELYTMSPDGGDVIRLTDDPASDMEPAFSPDGWQLAFSSNREGNFDIYVLNLQGTGDTRQLTDHSGDDTGPVWRPNAGAFPVTSNPNPLLRPA